MAPWAGLGLSAFAVDVYLQPIAPVAPGVVTLAGFFARPETVRLFADLVGIGAFGALYIVPLNTALQARAAVERRSRVIAALNVWNALFMVGSALFTLLLFGRGYSIPQVFALTSALNIALLLTALSVWPALRTRAVRVLSRTPDDAVSREDYEGL